jgi:hypothetical protein
VLVVAVQGVERGMVPPVAAAVVLVGKIILPSFQAIATLLLWVRLASQTAGQADNHIS